MVGAALGAQIQTLTSNYPLELLPAKGKNGRYLSSASSRLFVGCLRGLLMYPVLCFPWIYSDLEWFAGWNTSINIYF